MELGQAISTTPSTAAAQVNHGSRLPVEQGHHEHDRIWLHRRRLLAHPNRVDMPHVCVHNALRVAEPIRAYIEIGV